MSEPRKCSKCGAELPAGAAGVHCPQCLLTLGLATTQPAAPALNKTVIIPFVPGPPGEKEGDRIGRYTLLEKLGEGGMGSVWAAEQTEPVRRRVALKIIKAGLDTKEVIARFETERQALALMDHPNIAKVLDAGATETGRPYFVMEHVEGVSITDYCDRHNLAVPERLDLFVQVCRAFAHAHRNGVIHRDIKPSNILVTVPKGEDTPVPKVIDFGISKAAGQFLADRLDHSPLGELAGTLAYMSPEQAEMTGLGIDERSDIYSLGVLLYELLAAQTPLDPSRLAQAGRDGIARLIREEIPPSPSARLSALDATALQKAAKQRGTEPPKLIRLIQGDLDWIVMKCLEKDRTHRFKSAEALAQAVQRFLNLQPVIEPASIPYRLQKLLRRNRRAFAVSGGAAVCTLIALLMALAAFRGPASRVLAVPPPKALPQQLKGLPAAGALGLVYSGAPPAAPAGVPAPQMQFEILAKRQGATDFTPLRDGDSLASRVDDYVLVARALSPGYLYVFQVDAAGKTQWLFPTNHAFEFSSGANPVTADKVLQLPPAQKKAFYLDATPGIEHVYVVFSAKAWPELEAVLSKPSPPVSGPDSTLALIQQPNLMLSRGIAGTHDTAASPGAPVAFSTERLQDGQTYTLSVAGRPLKATGAFLVLERWFRHVNSL